VTQAGHSDDVLQLIRGRVVPLQALVACVVGAAILAGCGGDGQKTTEKRAADPLLTRDVPTVVRFDCRRAARRLTSGAVYCPPLVPRGATRSQNTSSRGRFATVAHDGEYVLNFVAAELAGVDLAQPAGFRHHVGHWLAASYEGAAGLTSGPGVRVLRRIDVDGVEVTLYQRRWIAYKLDAGHVFASWPLGGRTYEVSLHGFENRHALVAMAEALVAEIRECPPDGPTGVGAEPPCDLVFPAG